MPMAIRLRGKIPDGSSGSSDGSFGSSTGWQEQALGVPVSRAVKGTTSG